jgi:hypothetical protein
VIRHHSAGGDFSRWIVDVFGDPLLGAAVAAIEADVVRGASAGGLARRRLLQAIHDRCPG